MEKCATNSDASFKDLPPDAKQSSIPSYFRAKRVKTFMSIKSRKYAKNEEKNIDLFIFTFSRLIIIKSYENR